MLSYMLIIILINMMIATPIIALIAIHTFTVDIIATSVLYRLYTLFSSRSVFIPFTTILRTLDYRSHKITKYVTRPGGMRGAIK